MSNVSYDLDTSGGLMPLIRALIKPPDEEPNVTKPKKPQHPYYKRPGKGHNHDSCDACGEGGDLICCDRCPASFHLGCYDPPLDENDIPAGQWLCRECRAADAEKPSSARGSRAHSPADNKSDTDKKTRSLRNNRTNSVKKKSKEEEQEDKKKEVPEKELTPMEILVRAARIMNPRQFELPNEMKIPCIFPGTEKDGSKNGNSSLVTVDAWGCVPLPAKLCFVCQQTCKQAPLLQCDYCPLLFHQDCLDPPLTALPTGRWMCPNHVEQYIDWKLVNSISATERVALWEQFSGPVDQHAIKTDFIRRARNARPAFRIKVPVGIKGRVLVPDMVRYHYKNPPPLLPSRREYTRCVKVLQNLKATKDIDLSEEDMDAPKHKICLNLSCPQYSGDGPCPHASREAASKPSLQPATDSDAADDLKAIAEPEPKPKMVRSSSSSDLSDSDFEYLTACVRRRRGPAPSPRQAKRAKLARGDAVRDLLQVVDERLSKLDSRLVRLLAWQQLQQISWGEQCIGSWSRCPVSARAAHAVRTSLAQATLATRGEALPSALLSAADRRRIAAAVWGAPPAAPPTPPLTPVPPPDAYVRATLTAVKDDVGAGDMAGTPIALRRACVTVGIDNSCDVRLPRDCRNVAPHHATIFMDEVTRHFELINYSEWGTVVNGVLYACSTQTPEVADTDALPTRTLRELVERQPKHTHRINGSLTEPTDSSPCRCAESPAESPGAWEGSALVPHGALLQFGCARYVFSITDAMPFPYVDMPEEPAL